MKSPEKCAGMGKSLMMSDNHFHFSFFQSSSFASCLLPPSTEQDGVEIML